MPGSGGEEEAMVSVRDYGPGIADEHIPEQGGGGGGGGGKKRQ